MAIGGGTCGRRVTPVLRLASTLSLDSAPFVVMSVVLGR
eukprot:CAMPEP_0115101070 /NCGR_PEP_ID=MMETSP0227-20121206/32975_1 /TAXON_ID=89957 /ORGANISM="Polarella glacialis, Strain CCMP 1383" /LENGTH=38 /DNA_ID= /DNA_START= /DNA_END= /DNA_ORIENTATION=